MAKAHAKNGAERREKQLRSIANEQLNLIEEVLRKKTPRSALETRKSWALRLWNANGYSNWDKKHLHLLPKSIWDREVGASNAGKAVGRASRLASRLQQAIDDLPVEAIDLMLAEAGVDINEYPGTSTKLFGEALKLSGPSRIPAALNVPHLFELNFVLLPRFIAAATSAQYALVGRSSSANAVNRPARARNAAKPRKELIARVALYAFAALTGKRPDSPSGPTKEFVSFLEALFDDGFRLPRNRLGRSGAAYMAKKALRSTAILSLT